MELSDIISSLKQEDIEKLRETANRFFSEQPDTVNASSEKPKSDASSSFDVDPKMIETIMRFSSMLSENDDKTQFLLSLRPLLSERRRQNVDAAIRIQRLLRVFRIIGKEGASGEGAQRTN